MLFNRIRTCNWHHTQQFLLFHYVIINFSHLFYYFRESWPIIHWSVMIAPIPLVFEIGQAIFIVPQIPHYMFGRALKVRQHWLIPSIINIENPMNVSRLIYFTVVFPLWRSPFCSVVIDQYPKLNMGGNELKYIFINLVSTILKYYVALNIWLNIFL